MRPDELILASASPRRRALLSQAGAHFEVLPADVDESPRGERDPVRLAIGLARRKAEHVAARHAGEERWVLGADTVVAIGGPAGEELLGKPAGPTEAARMLALLSGSSHRVVTGLCVVATRDGSVLEDVEITRVSMRALEPEEVAAYVASGEWRDKAGGYAIQESADAFVSELAGGGFDNVVGLPVERALDLLLLAGAPRACLGRSDTPGGALSDGA